MKRWGVALLGISLALASKTALALTCTSVAGFWNAAGSWTSAGNCNRIPTVADTVIINTNMVVNVNTANVQSITVNTGRTLMQTTNTMQTAGALQILGTGVLTSGNTLVVSGATTVDGTLNLTAGAKTFTGAVTNNGTWNNSGNVAVGFGNNLTNTGTFTSGTNTQTFSNAAATTMTGTTAMTFSGPVSVTPGTLTVAAGTVNFANAVSVNGTTSVTGTLGITSATGAKTFTGNVTVNGSPATWSNSANSNVSFGGNLTNSTGGTFTSGTGTNAFTAATATLTGTAAITFNGTTTFGTNLAVAAGTVNFANAVTVTGTTAVTGTLGITSTTGAKTFTGNVTINASPATWSNSGNSNVSFGGNLTNSAGGTFTSGTGTNAFTAATATLTGTAAITFSGPTTFGTNLAVAAGTVNFANAVTVTGTTAVTGTLGITSTTGAKTFTGNVTINASPATWSNSGNSNVSFGGNLTNSAGGTFTSGTGTNAFTAATATLTGTAAITFSGPTTFGTNLAVAAGTVNFANAVTVTGTTGVTGTLGITSTTGTKTFTGTVTINAAPAAWSNTANANVSLGGNLTRGTGTFTSGSGTLTFTAATATISGGNFTFGGNVTSNNINIGAGIVLTNNATATVTGAIDFNNGTSGWTNGASSVLNLTGNFTGNAAGDLTVSAGTPGTATCNTVNYSGTGQTVKAPVTSYCNLTISGTTATVAAATTVTVAGDLTVSGGLAPNATSTMAFTGNTGIQTLTGAVTFGNLTFNNSGTSVRVKDPIVAAGTFTLSAGVIDLDTDSSSIEVTSACPVTRTGGQIVGSLKLHYPTAAGTTTCVFHIGTTTAYLPVTVAMTGVSSNLANSTLTVRTDAGEHTDLTAGVAGVDSVQGVNRYWTMTGGGSLVFTRHSTTFTFLAAEVDGGATTAEFEVTRLTGGTWFSTAPGTRTATTTQVVSETTFGIYVIGELFDLVFSEYHMEETAQIGGAIADTSGNGNNGLRLGTADTLSPVPANGVATICRGLNIPNNLTNTISALNTGFVPSAAQYAQHGTITFWYKSTTIWNGGGDRQLLDASTSTTQFFSLVLLTNGRLTLAMRDTTGAAGYNLVQNVSSGIAANTWAHIGITWNFASGTFQIFVNGAAVVATLTTVGTPNGFLAALSSLYVGDNRQATTVGGVLGTLNSANGVIDEVRIYRGVRTATQIATDRLASYTGCNFATLPGRFNGFETGSSSPTTGSINTKTSGLSTTIKLVAVNVERSALDTTFVGTAKVELLDASDDSGTLDANQCRSSWTVISSPAPTLLDATFAAGVVASYSFTVPDAYRNVRLRISYPSTATTSAVKGCSTDNFAVRPASLSAVIAQDETWATPYTTGTPRSLDNSGQVHKAGQPFSISLTALNNASVGTANYDGSPTVVSGSLTLVSPAPASAECTTPNPACALGTFNPGGWSVVDAVNNPGVIRASGASYNEVGVFSVRFEDLTWTTVDSADANPASSNSTIPATAVVTIGRFVPNHFVVAANATPIFQTFGVADGSCGGTATPKRSFTYVGQTFNWLTPPSITITPKAADGTTTTALYRGSLFKVTGAGITYTYNGNSGGATFNATPATASVTAVNNGTGTATAGADAFSYARPSSVLGAFQASISMTMDAKDQSEADGAITTDPTGGSTLVPVPFNTIAFDGGDFNSALSLTAGKTFVYGRARLLNAYGASQNDLPVALRAEYYNGSLFATNTKDHCTGFASGDFKIAYPAGSTLSGLLGGVSISGTLVSGLADLRVTKPSSAPASPGAATICLDLDPTTSTGDTTCQGTTAANKSYLQGAWSGSNNDKDPTSTLGFGIFGGPKNLIYLRENY